jgi:two-component SAPR family response regulator
MVSSRNLVVSKDSSSFYNLSYTEYIASTYLQLYEYSIKDGSYRMLGDSIPMVSERIRTNANLYINKATNQLFCTTQEFELDGSNRIKIYSLNAPPVSKEIIYNPIKKSTTNTILLLLVFTIILLVLLFTFLFIKKRKKKKEAIQIQVQTVKKYNLEEKKKEVIKPNSIILFGSFKVIDNREKDISYLFSPKIRQLFLLLLFKSRQKDLVGITSEQIHNILWPDSNSQKAKNLKNVALNQLRNILKDFDGIEINYSNGHFFMEFGDELYCDYFSFLTQLESLKNDLFDENSLSQLIQIISTGKFLRTINDEYFDQVKKDFEYEVLKIIPNQLKLFYKNKEYAAVIPLAEILFNIDPLNEVGFYYSIHSLLKLGMKFKAKKQFNYFILEHNKIMGDDFKYTYRDVIKDIPEELK